MNEYNEGLSPTYDDTTDIISQTDVYFIYLFIDIYETF